MNNKKMLCVSLFEEEGLSISDVFDSQFISIESFAIFGKPQKIKSKVGIILQELYSLCRLFLILHKVKGKFIYVTGGYYSLMLLNKIFPFLFVGSHFLICNFYLHSLGEKKVVEKVIKFLFDMFNCILIVQTPYEKEKYSKLLEKAQVRFVPYCSDMKKGGDAEIKDYIFTGGYTNRDYWLMLKLAKRMPLQNFVFIASKLNVELKNSEIPNNVIVLYDVDTITFEEYLSKSVLVVIPLKENVGASGQMLCLQAMRNRKIIIYADVSSINYYFEKNSGIPYELGNIDSLTEKIVYALENVSRLKNMGERAYDNSLRYTVRSRNELLLEIVKESKYTFFI